MTESYQYASINRNDDINVDNNTEIVEGEPKQQQSRRSKLVLAALAVLAVLGVTLHSSYGSQQSQQGVGLELEMEGASQGGGVTPCTFRECTHSQCDHDSAPFTCLFHNGGPHGGCSGIPWVEGSCTTQCDLSECDSLDVPDDAASCEEKKCTKEWCAGGQLCGDDVSYQCTGGSGTFGCSSDKFHWTIGTNGGVCTECCDTTTC